MYVYIFFILVVLFMFDIRINTQFCGSGNGKGPCCENYYYNSNNKQCLACPLGSYGINCSKVCIPPNYGYLCYDECKCPIEKCHIQLGCINESELTMTPIISSREFAEPGYEIDMDLSTTMSHDDNITYGYYENYQHWQQYTYISIGAFAIASATIVSALCFKMRFCRSTSTAISVKRRDEVILGNDPLRGEDETYMEIDESLSQQGGRKIEMLSTSVLRKSYDKLVQETHKDSKYQVLHKSQLWSDTRFPTHLLNPGPEYPQKRAVQRSHSWHGLTIVSDTNKLIKTNSYLELSEDNYLDAVFLTPVAHSYQNLDKIESNKSYTQYDDFLGIIK